MPAMDVGDIPIFAMLKSRLGYLTERQKLIAQNVANANTPGYVAKDLKAFSFQSHVQAASGSGAGASVAATPPGMLAITQPGHLQPHASMHGMKAVATPDSEKSIDGTSVVLEDQMVKLTDTRMDYTAALGFYQQSLSMLKTAARRPGGN